METPKIPELWCDVERPLDIVARCGGYYECPKDDSGKRLGPLVGYAGKDAQGRQKVGDVYVNFAKVEQWPVPVNGFAHLLKDELESHFDGKRLDPEKLVFVGMPMGGIVLATHLSAQKHGSRGIFAEKAGDELILKRHDLLPGDQAVIVEDVCNNFSTTDKAFEMIEGVGAKVIAIVCFLNRSGRVEYEVPDANVAFGTSDRLPVISLVHKPFPQWEQDDPAVADDVAAGNVVWKPKHDWDKLEAAVAAAKTRI